MQYDYTTSENILKLKTEITKVTQVVLLPIIYPPETENVTVK